MVHHEPDAFFLGVFEKSKEVEVGIGCNEVEHILFPMAEPIFPADVPALNKHLVEPVSGCKVYVALHVLGVGSVSAVGFGGAITGTVDVY